MLLASCSSKDPYLYDRPGFDADSRPVVLPNANAPSRMPPDYYSQQPAYYNAPAPYYQQNQPQPAYRGSPSAYAPQQGYGSRYYSNPYAMPQQGGSPYYDGDQYYIPPTYYPPSYYNNSEPSQKSPGAYGSQNL